jgi:hypothetical protein
MVAEATNRNMLVKNVNTWLNIFIHVRWLVCHIIVKYTRHVGSRYNCTVNAARQKERWTDPSCPLFLSTAVMKKCSSYGMEHRHSCCSAPCVSWQLFLWSMDWAWRTKGLLKVPDLTPYNFLLWCLVKGKSSDHKQENLLNLSSKYKVLPCFFMFCWLCIPCIIL